MSGGRDPVLPAMIRAGWMLVVLALAAGCESAVSRLLDACLFLENAQVPQK